MTGLTIADEVLVLQLCTVNEGWRMDGGRVAVPHGLDRAVAGGLLAELGVLGRVASRSDPVLPVSHALTGDLGLDAALLRVSRAAKPRWAREWVRVLAKGRPHDQRLERLRERGTVRTSTLPGRGLRGTRQVPHVFVPEMGAEVSILGRCRRALDAGTADERTLALLGVMRATGLHRQWFRDFGAADLHHQIERLTAGRWYGRGVPSLGSTTALV